MGGFLGWFSHRRRHTGSPPDHSGQYQLKDFDFFSYNHGDFDNRYVLISKKDTVMPSGSTSGTQTGLENEANSEASKPATGNTSATDDLPTSQDCTQPAKTPTPPVILTGNGEHVMSREERKAKGAKIEDILRIHYPDMVEQVNPEIAAGCLYGFSIINKSELESAMMVGIPKTTRSSTLLRLLITKLQWNPHWCRDAVVALKKGGVHMESIITSLTDAGIDVKPQHKEVEDPTGQSLSKNLLTISANSTALPVQNFNQDTHPQSPDQQNPPQHGEHGQHYTSQHDQNSQHEQYDQQIDQPLHHSQLDQHSHHDQPGQHDQEENCDQQGQCNNRSQPNQHHQNQDEQCYQQDQLDHQDDQTEQPYHGQPEQHFQHDQPDQLEREKVHFVLDPDMIDENQTSPPIAPQPKIFTVDADGNTPLHLAVCKGDVATTMKILQNTPHIINYQNKRKETALHLSIKNRSPHVTVMLSESKICDAYLFDEEGRTALHHACASGMTDLVKPVLKLCTGVRFIDATDRNGSTALHLATREGFVEIMKLLRAKKANPHMKNYDQQTPIDIANATGNEKAHMVLTKWKYSYKFHRPSNPFKGKMKKSSTFTGAMSSYSSMHSINSQAMSSTCSEFVIESDSTVVEANH